MANPQTKVHSSTAQYKSFIWKWNQKKQYDSSPAVLSQFVWLGHVILCKAVGFGLVCEA